MRPSVGRQSIEDALQQARRELLGGRGPGASADQIAGWTRNRVIIAGETCTRRLEEVARQTARARRDGDEIASAIQLNQRELTQHLSQLNRWADGKPAGSDTSRGARERRAVRRLGIALAGAVIALVVRRGRRRTSSV